MARTRRRNRREPRPTLHPAQIAIAVWFYGSLGMAAVAAPPGVWGGLLHDHWWLRLLLIVALAASMWISVALHGRRVREWGRQQTRHGGRHGTGIARVSAEH